MKSKKRIQGKTRVVLTGLCASVLVSAPACNAAVYGSAAPHDLGIQPFHLPEENKSGEDLSTLRVVGDESNQDETANPNNTLRYKLLEARLNLETGRIYDATKQLNTWLEQPEYKDNSELLGFTANAENFGGNWPYATELLEKAHTLAPENQDVTDLLDDIRRTDAQNVHIGYDWIKYGHSLEDIITVGGFVNAPNHLQFGGEIKENYTMGRSLRLSNGNVGDANANRMQGEVYGEYSVQNGQRIKGAIFGNNDTAGVGGYYGFLNPLGRTTLSAEYHRPYWDIPEGVLDQTTRDRIEVDHVVKPNNKLTFEGDIAANRYNVEQETNVAESISGDFNVVYRLFDEVKYHKPFLDLGYNIDAEYMRSQKDSIDSDGELTHIFPLFSRQIHTPFAEVGYDFNPSTYGTATAGYEFDMLSNNSGPALSAKIDHELNNAFDVEAHASYGLDSANSASTITTLGGSLRYRF
ncbi:MAG TPA: hypothetical protein VFT64_01025 [Rickettsiales bacterium]|nr:hypothetical protein [Rickettsiales bacterium]